MRNSKFWVAVQFLGFFLLLLGAVGTRAEADADSCALTTDTVPLVHDISEDRFSLNTYAVGEVNMPLLCTKYCCEHGKDGKCTRYCIKKCK